jgi:LmbE family N-acetylglucosaminyl deacetylase
MLNLEFAFASDSPPAILCLGAHADDIEIGCGGTLLELLERNPGASVTWIVFGAAGDRALEASKSAERFLERAGQKSVVIRDFRDGFFPYVGAEIKELFEDLKAECSPDLVFTHYRNDLHQDHRLISELTWNSFRDHLVLEYEVPKYDGDLGTPNAFAPLAASTCDAKIAGILEAYGSQRDKHWFSDETFRSLLRIRGIESRSPSGYAEAFYGRKLLLFRSRAGG